MNCCNKKVVFVAILFNIASSGNCAVKIWKRDNDIFNPDNWVGGKPSEQCDGLDMRNVPYGHFLIDQQLRLKALFLPIDGEIYFAENARIRFDEDSSSTLNCVQLKEEHYFLYWNNPESWIVEGAEGNTAIPHTERVPCNHDTVVFPKGWKSRDCFSYSLRGNNLRLQSFRFGNENLTNNDLEVFRSPYNPVFRSWRSHHFRIDAKNCNSSTGCLCSDSYTEVCLFIEVPEYYDCLNPINPIGFCTPICGATITKPLIPDVNYKYTINDIRKLLKDYPSDSYVSKVSNSSGIFLQIILTEKNFTGTSLKEATQLYSHLQNFYTDDTLPLSLALSGPPRISERGATTALSIVFGSLCGVLLVFSLIFFVNSPTYERLNLKNRPLSTFLARYENTERQGLIFERASIAGSVISLDRSFDNPMYGTSTPSTNLVKKPEEMDTKSTISMENPMYDVNALNESEIQDGVTEENQLVDFTKNNE